MNWRVTVYEKLIASLVDITDVNKSMYYIVFTISGHFFVTYIFKIQSNQAFLEFRCDSYSENSLTMTLASNNTLSLQIYTVKQ